MRISRTKAGPQPGIRFQSSHRLRSGRVNRIHLMWMSLEKWGWQKSDQQQKILCVSDIVC